mgnify:CR=1 FL=1
MAAMPAINCDSLKDIAPAAGDVRPWVVAGQNVGKYEPASILASLPGFGGVDPAKLTGKTIRQIGRGQQDGDGNDVDGHFVVSDAAATLLFDNKDHAARWANNPNQVNIDIAPSLTYIESGNPNVSLF